MKGGKFSLYLSWLKFVKSCWAFVVGNYKTTPNPKSFPNILWYLALASVPAY